MCGQRHLDMVAENQLEKTGVSWKNKEIAKNEWRLLGTQLCCKSICAKAGGWKTAASSRRLYKSNSKHLHNKNQDFCKFQIGSYKNGTVVLGYLAS